jgi:hypothetical protein
VPNNTTSPGVFGSIAHEYTVPLEVRSTDMPLAVV